MRHGDFLGGFALLRLAMLFDGDHVDLGLSLILLGFLRGTWGLNLLLRINTPLDLARGGHRTSVLHSTMKGVSKLHNTSL